MTEQSTNQQPIALVAGATSGIGRAVTLQLAREGLSVIVHGRDALRGAATVQEIESAGRSRPFRSGRFVRRGPGAVIPVDGGRTAV